MEIRYKMLRLLGNLYKAFGILVGIGTIVWVIYLALHFPTVLPRSGENGIVLMPGAVGVLVWTLFYGMFAAITSYAFGEGIFVVLALETNTREANIYLKRMHRINARAGEESAEGLTAKTA